MEEIQIFAGSYHDVLIFNYHSYIMLYLDKGCRLNVHKALRRGPRTSFEHLVHVQFKSCVEGVDWYLNDVY